MLPAIILVGVGSTRRVWIPILTFLLWPIWLLAWAVWLPLWIFRIPAQKALRAGLTLGACLSGTRFDIESADGGRIHVRMI